MQTYMDLITRGKIMFPVVGEAACATAHSACAVSWGYGEMVVREMGREEEKWGEGPFYTSNPRVFLKCDTLTMSMSHVRLLCLLRCLRGDFQGLGRSDSGFRASRQSLAVQLKSCFGLCLSDNGNVLLLSNM